MKQSKIQLLENIKALDSSNEKLKEFLPKKNYKNLEKLELSLICNQHIEDDFGQLLPNLLPLPLQTRVPLTIFSLTDYYSLWRVCSNTILPSRFLWLLNAQGIFGVNGIIGLIFYPLPNNGDFIRTFRQNIGGVGYQIGLNMFSNFTIGYGTILNNLSDSVYIIQNIKIIFRGLSNLQLENPLLFSKQNIKGKIVTDSIDLRTYVLPSSYQQTVVDIPLNIILDKNLMINQYIEFDCQNIQYIFTLLKIK